MKIHEVLYAYFHARVVVRDPEFDYPHLFAAMAMTILGGLNLMTLYPLYATLAHDYTSLAGSIRGYALFGVSLFLTWFSFLRRRRFEKVMEEYDALSQVRKRRVTTFGIIYAVASFALFGASLIAIAR